MRWERNRWENILNYLPPAATLPADASEKSLWGGSKPLNHPTPSVDKLGSTSTEVEGGSWALPRHQARFEHLEGSNTRYGTLGQVRMKIVLKNGDGESTTIEVNPQDTFCDLKTRIKNEAGIELDLEQLKVNGRKITDDQFVSEYFFNDEESSAPDEFETERSIEVTSFYCAVPGCNSTQASCPDKTFFKFPISDDKCRHWLSICKRHDLIRKPSPYVNYHYTICSDHFIGDHFLDATRRELKHSAVPTIFNKNLLEDSCNILIKKESSGDNECSDSNVVEDEDECYVSEQEYDSGDTESGDEGGGEHPGELCRLCARNSAEMLYIYSTSGKDQLIAEKINTTLPVSVRLSDHLPKQLCADCVNKLNTCHEFAESCLLAEEKLTRLDRRRLFRSVSATINASMSRETECKNTDSVLSNETKSDSQIFENNNYCCPLCCKGNITVQNTETGDKDVRIDILRTLDGNSLPANMVDGVTHITKLFIDSNDSSRLNGDDDDDSSNAWEIKDSVEGTEISNDGNNSAHSICHATADFFPCSMCDLCFVSDSSFNSHCLEHTVKAKLSGFRVSKRLQCEMCNRRFNNERTHANHACETGTRPYKCDECGKFFSSEARLTFHRHTHKGANPMICEYCGKTFSRENNLFDHVRLVHMGEKVHNCHYCGKTFQIKTRLISHLRVHTGERPFECSYCDGKFYDNATLKGHMMCGDSFRLKDVRDAHERKHTGERPFKCNVCEKTFRTSHAYYQHTWIHQGKKPYPCNYCGKAFRRSNGLKIHIRIHTGEKPYRCDLCGRCFAQKQDMKKHKNLHIQGKL
uniref:Uncharacterized protein n=1 Tax=Timema genevievae TaxID=629358 RepID=A0A7R9JS02_TIMGE|nr:unnamed protein product [Timema genevievae]